MEKPKSLGRDSFKSSFGFIIACIGSAVGMGNIWLFPRRVSEFGAPFLIAYLVCVVVIGFTGVIGEMAFGRASKAGPMGAFETATQRRFGKKVARWGSIDDTGSGFVRAGNWILSRCGLDY